jgi:hypothetical protein
MFTDELKVVMGWTCRCNEAGEECLQIIGGESSWKISTLKWDRENLQIEMDQRL